MLDIVLEVVELALIALLGARALFGVRKDKALKREIEGKYEQTKRLYEKAQRNLNEHIAAPIHRR